VREEDVAEDILCSNDPERHVAAIEELAEAGFDHVLIQQCGPEQERLVELYAREVLPRVGSAVVG
jgi:alkanesulfonate monooxygenase SsuD/methylene tetrahydromethanopterin reductase-like flavin-dependent oxidoreductase (luciferase family)